MSLDAVVVGSGPNGLAAALTLARAGRSVRVLEAADTPGGGARTAELTLPGYLHDVCSAIHPLASASPFFTTLDLRAHGAELVHPDIPLAHPLDDGRAGVLHRSVELTAEGLPGDDRMWRHLVGWAAERWDRLGPHVLGPPLRLPRHPLTLAGFGLRGLLPATVAARLFGSDEAKALLAGSAAHGFLPLDHPLTTSFGILLSATGHTAGWPAVRGGSGRLIDAMVAALTELGGELECEWPVRSMSDLPDARVVLFDLTPHQVAAIASSVLPVRYTLSLRRYRYGPAVYKLDYALSEAVPWRNHECRRAGTVHVGGTIDEIAAAEAEVCAGRHAAQPFVLVAQQSIFDETRTPDDGHTLWAYAHVPHGSTRDVSDEVERQIERFASGFRDTILARHSAGPTWYEAYNQNNVGGDIAGGAHDGTQLLLRPVRRLHPYRTPDPRLFLCGASTPPGGGVHGMCGHNAALDALATTLS